MRALKLVQHMKANAGRMSEGFVQKIRATDNCKDLLLTVPAEEQKRYALEIYCDLTNWLAADTDSFVQQHYVDLGVRRAQQGVPFTQLFWVVCIVREHLWEYIQQECLLEEPVEFWGGVHLLRSLNQFFDRALYFTLVGYQTTGQGESAATSAAFVQR
jgi:hypothetical protein